MLTIRLPKIGEVSLYISTIRVINARTMMDGKDEDGNAIRIKADRFSCPDDIHTDYGYIHIIEYAVNGIATLCSLHCPIG